MKSLFSLFFTQEELKDFPKGAPWYFQWGLPGIRTILSYRKLKKALETDATDDSVFVAEALENFRANKFACLYGRRGNARLRALVEEAQNRGVATKDELRALVRYRDIRTLKGGDIQIRIPTYSAIGASMYLFITTTYFLLVLLLLVMAPGGLLAKLPLFMLISILYAGCSLPFYTCAIHPFLIIRRIRSCLENLDAQLAIITSPVKLYAVN